MVVVVVVDVVVVVVVVVAHNNFAVDFAFANDSNTFEPEPETVPSGVAAKASHSQWTQ